MADLVQYWTHRACHDAIDRNCAARFAFIDHLFGTAVQSDRQWPQRYGVVGDDVPDGFLKQLAFPFVWRPQRTAAARPPSGDPPVGPACRMRRLDLH